MSHEINQRLREIEAQLRFIRSEMNNHLGPRIIQERYQGLTQRLAEVIEKQTELAEEVHRLDQSVGELTEAVGGVAKLAADVSDSARRISGTIDESLTRFDQHRSDCVRVGQQLRALRETASADTNSAGLLAIIAVLTDHFSGLPAADAHPVDLDSTTG